MRYKGFTRIPHSLLDSPEGLTTAERCVLFCVYRLTAGYGRDSWKILFSTLREMSGVAGISRVCKNLAHKKKIKLSDYKNGKSYIFTIPQPITLCYRPHDMGSSNPSHHVNGSRRPIDNIIDNSIESTLSDDLVVEMKSKYPNIDVDAVIDKMFKYYNGKSVPYGYKLRQWCESERPSANGAGASYKLDTSGFPMAYCEKCSISESYRYEDLNGDSRCCNAKLLPAKP